MRWQLLGVAAVLACSSAVGRSDWLTLTSGVAGVADPVAASEFWFDTPHGPSVVAVAQVTGGETVQATTGGGTTFFSGLGTPVLLTLDDGSAYLAGGSPPPGTTGRGPNGGGAGSSASVAPLTGMSIPSGAALLRLAFDDLGTDGSRGLTVTVTDGAEALLGTGVLAVPAGGWWVVGLGPGRQPTPDEEPIVVPDGDGDSEPTPVPVPAPVPAASPGVPEPATLTLAAVAMVASGLTTVPLRRRRRPAANA